MSSESAVPAPGCLVLLLQLSASMKIDVPSYRGPFPKSHLVRLLADEVVEDLIIGYGEGVVPGNFEVSMVGYRATSEGPPVVSLLPDDKTQPHFLTVAQLAQIEVPQRKRGDNLRKWSGLCGEDGEPSPSAALASAHWIVQRWQADHPRAHPPIVVHCCDGEGLSADYDLIARSIFTLRIGPKPPVLFHCIFCENFSGRMLPYQYCGGLTPALERLWSLSSVLQPEQLNCRGQSCRGFAINDWPRTELKQAWERLVVPPPAQAVAPPPLAETAPAAANEPVAGEILELPIEPDPQPDEDTPLEFAQDDARIDLETAALESPMPLFSHRSLWLVKRGNDANQWEDAICVEARTGVVAIADGAGAGIFCRQWAALLAEQWVKDLPDVSDPNVYRAWMDTCRNAWMEAINYKTIRIFQRMKVDDVGAAATLLGLRIEKDPRSAEYRWNAVAVGDSVLFWTRPVRHVSNLSGTDDKLENCPTERLDLLAAFPLTRGSQFDIAPLLLRSKRLPSPGFARAGGVCQAGDLFVLATDAVAHALFDEHGRGPVDWARFETLDAAVWEQEMDRLRDNNRMVNDDCTLVILRVGARTPAADPDLMPMPREPIPEIPNE